MTPPRGRIASVSGHERLPLAGGWQMLATAPGAIADPTALPTSGWQAATAPATAASVLRAAGAFSLDGPARNFDAEDWWWRARFTAPAAAASEETVLCLDGLATVADVWLDGAPLFTSENMFLAHERAVPAGEHELCLRFRALDTVLGAKRPRPRWRVPMIQQQQLRWQRTTLLGRTPGWSPPAAAVGPWREVRLERRRDFEAGDLRLRQRLEGDTGALEVSLLCRPLGGAQATEAAIVLEREGRVHRAPLRSEGERLAGVLHVPQVARWWPHTHGAPARYRAHLELDGTRVELGDVGFRALALDTANDGFGLAVNGVPVFCRGACWTPLDPLTLAADRAALGAALDQVVAAGMNMLRVGGTMVYESDDFYDLCDERGVLVWQDFMFANMDYPEDAAFTAGVQTEARQILARLQGRPSLAVLCGSSEGEQQAAMWGAGRERWSPPLFHQVLPALCAELCPDVPYWPSSAHGGAFPHQASAGTTSYYGVGAYLRPLEDARRAEVRFASECLAFANVPAARGLPGGASLRAHHAAWKARSPRDLGAGWDFDDVRDHYLGRLFGMDPAALRATDHDRYLALGRVVTGEVMAAVFAEWRRARSTCRGGLVWFLRDLWPGAGWGVLDARGAPKAAYHYLRRALQPVALSISDEGVNGLVLHATNEAGLPLDATVDVSFYQDGEVRVGGAQQALALPPRAARELPIAALLEGFQDLSYAYRFGPPSCDLVVANLRSGESTLAEAFHFPVGMPSQRRADLGLEAQLHPGADGNAELRLRARRFAQAVAIEVDGFVPEDDFFHIAPGGTRSVRLRRAGNGGSGRGSVQALNATSATPVTPAMPHG